MYVSPTPGMKIHQNNVSCTSVHTEKWPPIHFGGPGLWGGWGWVGGMGCWDGKYWNSTYIHVWCNVGMVEC